MSNWSDEETDDPHYADRRNFYKVEKWSRDGLRVELMLYAGNSLDKARRIFERTTKHRPRIRLTIRQRTRGAGPVAAVSAANVDASFGGMIRMAANFAKLPELLRTMAKPPPFEPDQCQPPELLKSLFRMPLFLYQALRATPAFGKSSAKPYGLYVGDAHRPRS